MLIFLFITKVSFFLDLRINIGSVKVIEKILIYQLSIISGK